MYILSCFGGTIGFIVIFGIKPCFLFFLCACRTLLLVGVSSLDIWTVVDVGTGMVITLGTGTPFCSAPDPSGGIVITESGIFAYITEIWHKHDDYTYRT